MISIIIPVLNEENEILNKTISSVLETCPNDIEVIVVDDSSDHPIIIEEKYRDKIIFHRNPFRMGAAQTKHIGVTFSTKQYIYLTDSHVLFENGWYEQCLKSMEKESRTLWCGSCLGLSRDRFDLKKVRGEYTGAKLFLHNEKDNEILDGKWIPAENKDEYEISCIMGANYFMHKDWFFKIRGYGDLRAWGSEEPCLSIKTWLAGGSVKINRKVRMGHMFRDAAPYQTPIRDIIYNKIRMAKTFFSKDISEDLVQKISKKDNFVEALNFLNSHYSIIDEYSRYYQSIFVRDVDWLCKKFNIDI